MHPNWANVDLCPSSTVDAAKAGGKEPANGSPAGRTASRPPPVKREATPAEPAGGSKRARQDGDRPASLPPAAAAGGNGSREPRAAAAGERGDNAAAGAAALAKEPRGGAPSERHRSDTSGKEREPSREKERGGRGGGAAEVEPPAVHGGREERGRSGGRLPATREDSKSERPAREDSKSERPAREDSKSERPARDEGRPSAAAGDAVARADPAAASGIRSSERRDDGKPAKGDLSTRESGGGGRERSERPDKVRVNGGGRRGGWWVSGGWQRGTVSGMDGASGWW